MKAVIKCRDILLACKSHYSLDIFICPDFFIPAQYNNL